MALDEPGAADLAETANQHDTLIVSQLVEAELAAALAREGQSVPDRFLADLEWVLPTRRLTPEIDRALAVGHLCGADLLHVATALYAVESPADIAFLTLDERQREVAVALGFRA